MRDLLERALRAYQTPTGKKMFRYTMVSVVSTAVSLGVLAFVFGVLRWSQVPSAVFANVVATVPSYYLNRKWAWGKSGRSHFMKEVVPFWATSFAGLVLSTLAAYWAKHFTIEHGLHHFGATVIILGANFTAYGLLWIGKFLIFNKLFHHAHAQPDVELVDS
jgi:putative flippase GtrA